MAASKQQILVESTTTRVEIAAADGELALKMEEGFTYLLFGEVWFDDRSPLINRNSPITCEPKVEEEVLAAPQQHPALKEVEADGRRVQGGSVSLRPKLPKLKKNDLAPLLGSDPRTSNAAFDRRRLEQRPPDPEHYPHRVGTWISSD